MTGIEAAFLGVLGRDGEARMSKAGRQYLRLNVRVGGGDAAQWVSVLCFDGDAVAQAERFVAGVRVYCEGRLTANGWMDSDGKPRANLSVLSGHTRLAQIGRNRKRKPNGKKLAIHRWDSIPR